MSLHGPTTVTFRYTGMNQAKQKMSGDIEAKSLILAKVALSKQGITVNKIAKKRIPLFRCFMSQCQKIKSAHITTFSRQLATLIESGIPLVESLDILEKNHSNQNVKELMAQIKQDVETGLSLSRTLRKYPMYFNALFCHLIHAGEHSGSLGLMLDKIATYKEKIETIKKKIKTALAYPLTVLLVVLLVTTGLLIFVVPQFESLFKEFGADLPIMTQAVVTLSRFVQSYGYFVLTGCGVGVYAGVIAGKNLPQLTKKRDVVLLKIPLIGPILRHSAIARFVRTLSITFAAGLPLVEALQSVAGATGHSLFFDATVRIREEVSTGQQLNEAMKNTHVFPNKVVQMVAIGEESGTLEKILSKLADFYEAEVAHAVEALGNVFEPVIMVVLGILVGGLVIAMYLPIFKLGSAL